MFTKTRVNVEELLRIEIQLNLYVCKQPPPSSET